ncbi:MAG: hypothetical protein V4691_09645, partial [Pseudomonadota bacterium]
MRAHGSLDSETLELTEKQKLLRVIEMIFIYCAVPVLMTIAVHAYGVSLLVILQPILLILVLWL